jgi:hypothetical protein
VPPLSGLNGQPFLSKPPADQGSRKEQPATFAAALQLPGIIGHDDVRQVVESKYQGLCTNPELFGEPEQALGIVQIQSSTLTKTLSKHLLRH